METEMDIKSDVIKLEPVSTINITFENDDETKMNIIEIMPATLKQEPPDDVKHETNVKKVEPIVKEEVSLDTLVKEETCSDVKVKEEIGSDDAGEGVSGVKTEELMIKSESDDESDSSIEDNAVEKNKKHLLSHNTIDDRCNSISNYQSDLRRYACDFCNYKTPNKSDLDEHMSALHSKRYNCDYCTYVTTSQSDLRSHMLKQCKEIAKKHACTFCDYRTYLKAGLRTHIMAKHDDNAMKKYGCSICNYRTVEKRSLKRHIMFEHDRILAKRYGCDLCQYRTVSNKLLKHHIMIKHDKNSKKEYICDLCNFRTLYKGNLVQHILAMHDKNVVKQFCCHLCNYRTYYKSNLAQHTVLKHNRQYCCDLCDYRTALKKELRCHAMDKHNLNANKHGFRTSLPKKKRKAQKEEVLRKKTTIKYVCDVCSYETHNEPYLKAHKYITHGKEQHDKLYKYRCNRCIFKTIYKQSLKRHILTVHSNGIPTITPATTQSIEPTINVT